jgi:hypothetical protein
MGKRALVQFNLRVSPALLNPAPPLSFTGDLGIVNVLKSFQLEYVLTRKLSAGLSYNTYNSKVDWVGRISETDNMSLRGDVTGASYGINLKIYGQNVAPLGSYIMTEFLYMPYTFTKANNSYSSSDMIAVNENGYTTYGLVFQMGNQRIFFNRIVTNFGVSFGYVFKTLSNIISDDNLTNDNATFIISNNRLLGMSIFNLNLGIGLLIF